MAVRDRSLTFCFQESQYLSNILAIILDYRCLVPIHHLCYPVCGRICYRTWVNSMVFCQRAIPAICTAYGRLDGSSCKLDCEFLGSHNIWTNEGKYYWVYNYSNWSKFLMEAAYNHIRYLNIRILYFSWLLGHMYLSSSSSPKYSSLCMYSSKFRKQKTKQSTKLQPSSEAISFRWYYWSK